MEDDPDKINDAARKQVESTLLKVGEGYAARNKRSKSENEGRKKDRETIKDAGFEFPSAFHKAIQLVKDLSARELEVWIEEFNTTLRVMGARQGDLFREEQLKAAKRESARAAKEAKAKAAEIEKGAPPAEPKKRGRPKKNSGDNSGNVVSINRTPGAAMREHGKEADAALADAIADNQAAEQDEGGDVLDEAIDHIKDRAADETGTA